eukprot:4912408-Amphidinium_carterae.2
MVSFAVKEVRQNSDCGEMNYIAIICHAFLASPGTVIDVKTFPAMKKIPVLLRCVSERPEQMGSRIADGAPADMRYWQRSADEKLLFLKVGGLEAKFQRWLPSREGCIITDAHIMEKSKLHSPKYRIDVTCLQLVTSGDCGDEREPVNTGSMTVRLGTCLRMC